LIVTFAMSLNTSSASGWTSEDLKAQASEILGVLVILGSFMVKIPVIINVVKYKSSKGLSTSSLYAQCLSLSAFTSYHLLRGSPLRTWAENLSVLIQNVILVLLAWHYSRARPGAMLFVTSALAGSVAVMWSLPDDLLWTLPMASMSIGISGLIPQIWENYKNGHTGAQSIITQTLNVLGVVARIFTTLQLVKDSVVVLSLSVSSLFHFTLLAQIVWLRKATHEAMDAHVKAKTK